MSQCYISFGSNQGDKSRWIEEAKKLINEIPDTKIVKESFFKEYKAVEESQDQDPFLNGVVEIQTDMKPLELLHKLQVIERKCGRKSKGDHAPRVIDLDMLTWDSDVVFAAKHLVIPHPKMHERIFVLEPLNSIAPAWVHPKLQKTVQELLKKLSQSNEVHSVHSEN